MVRDCRYTTSPARENCRTNRTGVAVSTFGSCQVEAKSATYAPGRKVIGRAHSVSTFPSTDSTKNKTASAGVWVS